MRAVSLSRIPLEISLAHCLISNGQDAGKVGRGPSRHRILPYERKGLLPELRPQPTTGWLSTGDLRLPVQKRHNGIMRPDTRRPPETVTASEIANWVYCPESWRLDNLGLPSANQQERDAGTRHHAHKAVAEQVAGGSIALGRILVILALLALVVLWAVSR